MVDSAKPRSWFGPTTSVVMIIIVVNILAHGLFFVPALYSDDWSQGIERTFFKNTQWFEANNRRPLLFVPFLLEKYIFGINVTAQYIILWLFQIILAVLFYFIIYQIPKMRRYNISLIITLLFLTYPTVYTQMWLTTIHIYYAVCFTLLYGIFLQKFMNKGIWIYLLLSIIFLVTSFGFYEAQLGIACVWVIILLIAYPGITTKRRLAILCVLTFIVIGFMLWRTSGNEIVGVNDPYLSIINISVKNILFGFLQGYKVNLGWGWTTTILYWLPWLPGAKFALLLLVGVTISIWLLLRHLIYRPFKLERSIEKKWPFEQRWPTIRIYIISSLIGLIIIGAGYIPVMAIYQPNLEGLGSRVNFIASLGSAIFLASILMIGSLLFSRIQRQVRYLFYASSILFVMLGIVTQVSVQYDTKVAWREQTKIWRDLFKIAPNFRNDTMVLFILPGYEDRVGYQNWKRTPLYSSWEVSSALRLLYNNPTLSADVIFPDIIGDNEPTLTLQGILDKNSRLVTPYSQVAAFIFDNKTESLQQLDEIPTNMVDTATSPIKLGVGSINSNQIINAPLRRLVNY